MLPQPCILGGSQTKGGKIRFGRLNPDFSGPRKRTEMLRQTLHSRECPKKAGENQNLLPGPCLFWGPKKGNIAMSPLHSW